MSFKQSDDSDPEDTPSPQIATQRKTISFSINVRKHAQRRPFFLPYFGSISNLHGFASCTFRILWPNRQRLLRLLPESLQELTATRAGNPTATGCQSSQAANASTHWPCHANVPEYSRCKCFVHTSFFCCFMVNVFFQMKELIRMK